jgi:hypothetical protein
VYALTLPAESVLEASAVERVTALAKGQNIAPEAAQKVMEFANAEVALHVQKIQTDYTAKVNGWENSVKADPELGGANLTRTTKRGEAVLARFEAARPAAAKELREAMKSSGFGNYPALVQLFDFYGSLLENDGGINPGGGNAPAPTSGASKLWPNLKPA